MRRRIPAPAVTGSGRGRSRVGSGGQLVNFFAEEAGQGADVPIWLNGTPGLTLFADLGDSYVRAMHRFKGFAYAVTADGLYRVKGNGTTELVAGMSVSRRAVVADNGLVMVIVDGNRGWAFTGETLREISEDGFYPADNVAFFNNYFVFNRAGTGQFFWSELLAQFTGSSLDPLDFATAEYAPDDTVGIETLQQQLWLFGVNSVEVWYASGDEATFTRVPGAVIDRGCAGSYAHCSTGDNVFWLTPQGAVYVNAGYQGQRVSTPALEFDVKGRDLSSAFMWSYEDEGHTFVMLTLGEPLRVIGDQPAVRDEARTWCFDTATGQWHVRRHVDYGRHLANAYCRAYDRHLVGSFVDGKIYEMSLDAYTDAGRPLVSECWYAPLTNNRSRMFHQSFEVDGDWGWPDRVITREETTTVETTNFNVFTGTEMLSADDGDHGPQVHVLGGAIDETPTRDSYTGNIFTLFPDKSDTTISSYVQQAVVSADGSTAAAAHAYIATAVSPETYTVQVWDTSDGSTLYSQDLSAGLLPLRIALSPDGSQLAIPGHYTAGLEVRDVASGNLVAGAPTGLLTTTTTYGGVHMDDTYLYLAYAGDLRIYARSGWSLADTVAHPDGGTSTFKFLRITSPNDAAWVCAKYRSTDFTFKYLLFDPADSGTSLASLPAVSFDSPDAASPDGSKLAIPLISGGANAISIYQSSDWTVAQTVTSDAIRAATTGTNLGAVTVQALKFDPTNRYLWIGAFIPKDGADGFWSLVWDTVEQEMVTALSFEINQGSGNIQGGGAWLAVTSESTTATTTTREEALASLDWSDDGGMTWGDERIMGVGRVGERGHRFIGRRLGQTRDRIYRLRMDGAHPHRISSLGYIEGEPEA